jgi:homogentisate 1,2-dioxygenase
LYRNAAGDELVYVQSGRATMESVFGVLPVGAGDYVVIPASTTHRWVLEEPVEALVLETKGHVGIPPRYLTATGQMREGAPFSERDLRPPDGPLVVEEGATPVLVRSRQGWSRHCHATHPFDVVGWDGCCYPYAFSIHDFEPIAGRIHQPPPVHQTFAGPGFVVCSFVPRPFDFGEGVVKVPYHHANVDSDEVLFYSDGDFMSRKGAGIEPGSLTLHPAGFVHGPQPGSVEASMDAVRTEETAVMIDTFEPLLVSDAARSVAADDYPWSWARSE